jgi:hypothetical protein
MRALALLGVVLACAYGCSSDAGSAPSSSGDGGGEAGKADSSGGDSEAGKGNATTAGSRNEGGAPGVAGASAGGDAGHESEAGAAGVAAVSVGVVANGTHFLDCGRLRIGFEKAVDASTLTITLSPHVPERLVVTAAAQVDATTVDATLASYHLPRDYQLEVTGKLPDATSFAASAKLSGVDNGARAAFISQHGGSGDFSSWAGAPKNATPLEIADRLCQSEADAAGLRGEFRAFLSVAGSVDAGCRAFGLDALLSDNCGKAAMPEDHAPILSMNGVPIIAGGSAVATDAWAIPIAYHADGSVASPSYTWTGSITGGKGYENDDCDHWTTTASAGLAATEVDKRVLVYDFGRECTNTGNLLCMQTGGTFFGPSKLHEVGGKRAFITKGEVFGNISYDGKLAVAAGDTLCQDEAAAAKLENASKFHAYLGTTDTDALCYVLGQVGKKVADNCGLSALPATNPWRRPDNYAIGTAAELAAGTLQAPLMLAADLTRMLDARPRTGTDQHGATQYSCGDWTSTGIYSISGNPSYVSYDWSFHWTTDCDGEKTSLYCFEE